jgi:hypothetical protein
MAPHLNCLVSEEEDREEHDSFREGRAQDRLDENLRRRAGITPNGFRSASPDQSNADGGAKTGTGNVNASSHLS